MKASHVTGFTSLLPDLRNPKSGIYRLMCDFLALNVASHYKPPSAPYY